MDPYTSNCNNGTYIIGASNTYLIGLNRKDFVPSVINLTNYLDLKRPETREPCNFGFKVFILISTDKCSSHVSSKSFCFVAEPQMFNMQRSTNHIVMMPRYIDKKTLNLKFRNIIEK